MEKINIYDADQAIKGINTKERANRTIEDLKKPFDLIMEMDNFIFKSINKLNK